jgi:hypothetical protein
MQRCCSDTRRNSLRCGPILILSHRTSRTAALLQYPRTIPIVFPALTTDTYSHVLPSMPADAAARIDAAFAATVTKAIGREMVAADGSPLLPSKA